MNIYSAYDLKIGSEFELDELMPQDSADCDVFIKQGTIQFDISQSELLFEEVHYIKQKESFLLSVFGIADYEIRHGKEIIIDIKHNSPLNEFKVFLYGTCFSVLLLQRKTICLHGAGIVHQNKVNLFIGYSGQGKSTISTYFIKHGFSFLGDDTLPMRFDTNQKVEVGTSMGTVKLWEDNLADLGIEKDNDKKIREDVQKFRYTFNHQLAQGFFPIHRIFVLNWSDKNTPTEFQKLNPIEAIFYLREHIYRPQLITDLDEAQWMLDLIATMAHQCEVISINGKRTFKMLDKIKQMVL
jgi:hypothetical protein